MKVLIIMLLPLIFLVTMVKWYGQTPDRWHGSEASEHFPKVECHLWLLNEIRFTEKHHIKNFNYYNDLNSEQFFICYCNIQKLKHISSGAINV